MNTDKNLAFWYQLLTMADFIKLDTSSGKQVSYLYEKGWWKLVTNVFIRILKFNITVKEITETLERTAGKSDSNVRHLVSIDGIPKYVQKKEPMTDLEIYNIFLEMVEKKRTGNEEKFDNSIRGRSRVRDLQRFLPIGFKPTKYLDIGGGDGAITSAIGNMFKLSTSDVISADISQWYEDEFKRTADLTYVVLEKSKPLPFAEGEFDCLTCFQTLHHVENAEEMIKEIARVTKKGGYLILREHDCGSQQLEMIIDIEHSVYELVLTKRKSPEDQKKYLETYYAKYRSKHQWTILLQNVGFTFIKANYPVVPDDKNPTRFYYAMYKKT